MEHSASSGSLSFIQRVGLGTGQIVVLDYIATRLLQSSRPAPRRSITSMLSYVARVAALTAVELTLKQQLYKTTLRPLLARILGTPPQQDDDSSRLERLRALLMLQEGTDVVDYLQRSTVFCIGGPPAPPTCDNPDDGCPVCFEPVTDIRVAGCRHPICSDCAKRLCVEQLSLSCPMCRGPLEFESVHQTVEEPDSEEAAMDEDCTLDDLVLLEEWMREAMPTTVMLI